MNMSYCRFRNTRIALQDCINEMHEMESNASETLNDSGEQYAYNCLLSMAQEIVESFSEIEVMKDR